MEGLNTVLVQVIVSLNSAIKIIPVKIEESSKYFGVYVNAKLLFNSQINFIRSKLRKQCGIVLKMRRYVRETVTVKYYGSKIQPTLQYAILVYGCTFYANFLPLFMI